MKTINETETMKTSDDGNIAMTAEELRELVNMIHKRGALGKEAFREGPRQTDGESSEVDAKTHDDSAACSETNGDESSRGASSERANRDNAKVSERDGDATASDAETDEDGDDNESEEDEETGPLAGFLAGGIVGGLAGLLVGGIVGSIVESRD